MSNNFSFRKTGQMLGHVEGMLGSCIDVSPTNERCGDFLAHLTPESRGTTAPDDAIRSACWMYYSSTVSCLSVVAGNIFRVRHWVGVWSQTFRHSSGCYRRRTGPSLCREFRTVDARDLFSKWPDVFVFTVQHLSILLFPFVCLATSHVRWLW